MKILCPSHVWCDVHCTIHEAKTNPYGYDEPDCNRSQWRKVFVESTDPKETFT